MKPKVLLIGDTSGRPDEGMKKICQNIQKQLYDTFKLDARFISVNTLLTTTRDLKNYNIMHYIAGPSYRTFFYTAWGAFRIPHLKTVVSFTHPYWGSLAELAFKIFTPDCVIIQSEKWGKWANERNVRFSNIPLAGVDPVKYSPVNEKSKKKLREKLGLPQDKKIILHVGHLNPNRNLNVFCNLKNNNEFYPLVIASTTTNVYSGIYKKLIEAKVKIIIEYLPNIHEFFQAVDYYFFPTVDTHGCVQIPLSVIEASSAGIPVITTPFGGLPYYFSKNNSNLHFINNEEMTRLPEFISSLPQNATVDAQLLKRFFWVNIAEELIKLYTGLLENMNK